LINVKSQREYNAYLNSVDNKHQGYLMTEKLGLNDKASYNTKKKNSVQKLFNPARVDIETSDIIVITW
jgi:hypothetical protein